MNSALTINSLHKRFGEVTAVNDVSLTVQHGTIFGVIGADGAGKSTLFQMCTTLIPQDKGTIEVLSMDSVKKRNAVRTAIGYMPQQFSLYQDLTVEENLLFFADIFDITGKEREERIQRLLAFSRLASFRKRRAANLSGGMKQKLALCCCLIHTPSLCILDEPTTGVDPVSRIEFWSILRELKEQGVSLFISTPYMDEAAYCDDLAILHKGSIVLSDKPQSLCSSFKHHLYKIVGDTPAALVNPVALPDGIIRVYLTGGEVRAVCDRALSQNDSIAKLRAVYPLSTIVEPVSPTIEDVFINTIESEDTL
jgi:ABC-2 type transport system ATP-binding protein